MPFQSEAQRRYLWMHDPEVAKKWAAEYPGQGPSNLPEHVAIRRQATRQALLNGLKSTEKARKAQ